jgi:mRNA interferase RelE/StbE
MAWQVHLARDAVRALERIPPRDRERLVTAIQAMTEKPLGGDIKRLRNERAAFRRRVGSYRVFFDVDSDRQVVAVVAILRRTSTTY